MWLLFAQTITVSLALLFIVVTLKPEWVARPVMPLEQGAGQQSSQAGLSYAQAVNHAAPAVVNIYTSQKQKLPPGPFADPELNRLFREMQGGPERGPATNLGSGVIVDPQGYVLTNAHVVAAAEQIELALADGRRSSGRVVGVDPESDLAVLKVDLTDLPVIAAGGPAVQVGDVVLAIGNPFGVGQTTTMGIVSGVGRKRLGVNIYENFIQTDAAINPGNSGGALVDAQGRLVGINTAIYSETGGSLGIGFAIPADSALAIMRDIVEHGVVSRGWLGIEPQDITPDLARAFGLKRLEGVIIAGVQRGGPAAKAGLRVGDMVTHLDGQLLVDSIDLLNQIAPFKPGSEISLSVLREGRSLELKVRVGARPPARLAK